MKKEPKNKMTRYILNGGAMLLYSIIFSIIGIIFMVDKIPKIVQLLVGIVFQAPVMIIFFSLGKSEADKDYKIISKNTLNDIHNKKGLEIKWYKSLFYTISYAAPLLLLLILGVIIGNITLRGIVSLVLLPATLFFLGCNTLNFQAINFWSLIMYVPVILIGCGIFIIGYVLKMKIMKKQQAEIENELRTYSK